MFLHRLRDAARDRLQPRGEAGFTLIYVLMITTIVTVLVASALVVSASNVVPSVRSAYNQAATAAAQGGIQSFLADLNTASACRNRTSVAECTGHVAGSQDWTPIYSANGYVAEYKWSVTPTSDGGYFRVTATGRATQGAISATRTLSADVAGGASTNCLDYAICTQYETQAPDVVQQLFPSRTIALDATARSHANAVSGSTGTSVTWNAPDSSTSAGSINTCNALYYGGNGREFNPPAGADSAYVDWSATASIAGSQATSYQPCQVTLGASTKLLAPASTANGAGGYYTNDALLISNSNPGSAGGPLLDEPVWTGYSSTEDPNGSGLEYRSLTLPGYDPQVGGQPAQASHYLPKHTDSAPAQITAAPSVPAGSCVYTGPTRIKLDGDGSATITSPLTTSAAAGSPAGCYPTSMATGIDGFRTASLTGIVGFSGVFAVENAGTAPATPAAAHSSTGWNLTGQRAGDAASAANTVFDASAGAAGATSSVAHTASAADGGYLPVVGQLPSSKDDGAWNPQWASFTGGSTCSTSTDARDLRFFNCYQSGTTYSPTAYPTLRSTVQAALAADPEAYSTPAALQTYLESLLAAGNSADAANSTPAHGDNGSHRWVVSNVAADSSPTDGCTPASNEQGPTSTVGIDAPDKGDAMFTNTDGSVHSAAKIDTTCYTATIDLQIGQSILGLGKSWGDGGLLGLGLVAGSKIPQFSVTFTVKTSTTTTTTTAARSYFPSMSDITQYANATDASNAPGDLYVEGTAPRSLALVAANDVIITGSLRPGDSTSSGIEVVGQDNVRLYHPVSCLSTAPGDQLATTTAGFCPDDISGLYTTIPAAGYRPYEQYTNLRPDLAGTGMAIDAAIVALGTATSTTECPKWGGGGTCGGELTTDNYGRGETLGTLRVTGSVVEVHHGALGEEWEVPDAAGQSRPQSGYALTATYRNVKSLIADVNVVDTATTSVSPGWHVVSVSTGSTS